jgi:hypothetical protein
MRTLLFIAVILACRPLAAVVVTDDAVLKKPGFANFGEYGLERSNPTLGFLIWFDETASNEFHVTGYGIATEFRLYFAPAGTQLDPAYVSSQTPFFTNASPTDANFSIPFNSKRIISFWQDETWGFPNDIVPPNGLDHFGWVELFNNGNEVVISRSATAFGGGIVVGTLTQLPEPSTGLLGIGCSAAIGLYGARKRRLELRRTQVTRCDEQTSVQFGRRQ